MAIFEFTASRINRFPETTFQQAGLTERGDIQRLLRTQFDIIDPEVLVIAEEFGEWEDSRRRIDLLGLDKSGNLVVVELKRGDEETHMELQAIRYAAMISRMTFDQAVNSYQAFLAKQGEGLDARDSLLEFLGWDEPDDDNFAQGVRIVLVSSEFSREITTAVLWLIENGIDMKCIRIKPFSDGPRLLVDVQQVIPLPEAEQFMVSVRNKSALERIDREGLGAGRHHLCLKFWDRLLQLSRGKLTLFDNVAPKRDNWISAGAGIANAQYQFVVRKHDSEIDFALMGETHWNKSSFDKLRSKTSEIEAAFGAPLVWRRKDDSKYSYVTFNTGAVGIFSDESAWTDAQQQMIDKMILLEKALSPFIPELRTKHS